ncbi:hypothetical protein F4781DRAFT_405609 [Annulohypoxylon bovei var. microspora]|nr:hypothetical protein F4781DRAFT_405609 [Annulohypoxylon bovei var. microspora]
MDLDRQPNFAAMAQNMANLSEEFSLCRNLPAIDQGQQILAALQGIQADIGTIKADVTTLKEDVTTLKRDVAIINTRLDNLEGTVATINTRLGRLETRIQASDANSIARLCNNSITSPDVELEPLRSVLNNQIIEDLITSTSGIKAFNGPKVNELLQALGLDMAGNANAKKRRLLQACGIVLFRH